MTGTPITTETQAAAQPVSGHPSLEAILDIPVSVQVFLGGTTMPVAHVMKLGRGAVIPLDHRVGQPVDVVVNGRVIARGDMVVLEEDSAKLGVALTEIVGAKTPAARA